MDRPYMDAPIEELERLVRQHASNRTVLAGIREELAFRHTNRARQLRKEVRGLLAGDVPMPPSPPKDDSPENQLPLIG